MKKLAIYSLITAGLLNLIIGCSKERDVDTSNPPSLTQKGVTLTVTKIIKSIDYTFTPPQGTTNVARNATKTKTYGNPNRLPEVSHQGAMLIVWVTLTGETDALIDSSHINYTASLKDNLGNEINANSSYMIVGGLPHLMFNGRYSPRAKSFNLSCEITISQADTFDFRDVSLDSEHLSRTVGDRTVTIEMMDIIELEEGQILIISVKPPSKADVNHIGVKEIINNLGNRYQEAGRSAGSHNQLGQIETFQFENFNPDATSISFKYLIARDSLYFELKNLPMP